MSEPLAVVSDTVRFQYFIDPPLAFQFFDDEKQPINLTGVNINTGFTFVLNSIGPGPVIVIQGQGNWEIIGDATQGQASYQVGLGEFDYVSLFAEYVTVQLSNESTPRTFGFNLLDIQAWNGAPIMTTPINLQQINGVALTDDKLPIKSGDGDISTLGAQADAAWSFSGPGSGVAVLKAIAQQAKQAVTLDSFIPLHIASGTYIVVSANTSTTLTWGTGGASPIKRVFGQNNTGGIVYLTPDGSTCNVGAIALQNGQAFNIDLNCDLSIALFATSGFHVNDMSNSSSFYITAVG